MIERILLLLGRIFEYFQSTKPPKEYYRQQDDEDKTIIMDNNDLADLINRSMPQENSKPKQ